MPCPTRCGTSGPAIGSPDVVLLHEAAKDTPVFADGLRSARNIAVIGPQRLHQTVAFKSGNRVLTHVLKSRWRGMVCGLNLRNAQVFRRHLSIVAKHGGIDDYVI